MKVAEDHPRTEFALETFALRLARFPVALPHAHLPTVSRYVSYSDCGNHDAVECRHLVDILFEYAGQSEC